MLTDPLEMALVGAKNNLAGASKTTQTSLGNPLTSFEPTVPKPSIPQTRTQSPYAMVRKMRSTQ